MNYEVNDETINTSIFVTSKPFPGIRTLHWLANVRCATGPAEFMPSLVYFDEKFAGQVWRRIVSEYLNQWLTDTFGEQGNLWALTFSEGMMLQYRFRSESAAVMFHLRFG